MILNRRNCTPILVCLALAPCLALAQSPARIILTWSGDPAHTQDVTWRTETGCTNPQAQFAKRSADPAFPAQAATVAGRDASAGHCLAHFDNLAPGAVYNYRVGDGKTWSEWNTFRTASETPEPFKFIYLGDAQNSIKSLWSRSIRAAYAAAPDARFIAHAGDLLAEGYDDKLWGEWCDAMGFISANVGSLPVPGNHDLHRAPGSADAKKVLQASPLWRAHFQLPQNGPDVEELKSQSYFVDYQGLRIVAIDVNVFANEDYQPEAKERIWKKQLAWVEETLKNNPNRWTIVLQHQPIFARAKGREYAEMRAALAPLYEKYGVDVVLQGHDHLYARTGKVAAEHLVEAGQRGVIYVISVSGPKMYEFDKTWENLMAAQRGHGQFFQVIEVAGDRLSFKASALDGSTVDAFQLKKTATGTVYTNAAPVPVAVQTAGGNSL